MCVCEIVPSKAESKRSLMSVETMQAKKICHVRRCDHHDDTSSIANSSPPT